LIEAFFAPLNLGVVTDRHGPGYINHPRIHINSNDVTRRANLLGAR
jgi:hypothetical protein